MVWASLWTSLSPALEPSEVPAPLAPWIPWVLERRGDEACTKLSGVATCAWPGRLALELDDAGGRFVLEVTLDRATRVALPGGVGQWPQAVESESQRLVVQSAGDVPMVQLPPGEHRVRGRFEWRRLPETLAVAPTVALVQLMRRGRRVEAPRRDGARLWLGESTGEAGEPEALSLEVFRRLQDGVPFVVDTELSLAVGGASRPLVIERVLPEGALPVELSAELPARLEASGRLSLQLTPGRHRVRVRALYATPPSALTAPQALLPGLGHETWVFVPDPAERRARVSGAPSVDPERANVPEPWRRAAAYRLEPGGTLTLETESRGEAQAPPDRISIERELWLDFDGRGYTVRDRVSGRLNRAWRLDLLTGELGRVTVGGVDQLVTVHPERGTHGVELRHAELDVQAEWRLPDARGELPAVAWSENVEQLGSTLHLPPGWRLLGVVGADSVSASWLSSWDLFALFFVLVIAVAVARLDRPLWGVIALLALCLTHDEAHAPRWVWAAVLPCIALLGGLPAGRFRSVVRALGLAFGLVLLATVVRFGVLQIRTAIYPQVDEAGVGPWGVASFGYEGRVATRGDASMALEVEEGGADAVYQSAAPGRHASPKSAPARRATSLEQDANERIQTGPGLPSWRWRQWWLAWSGPVDRAHTLTLYLLSPAQNRVLAALRIALLGAFAFWALRLLLLRVRREPPSGSASGEPLHTPRTDADAAEDAGQGELVSFGGRARGAWSKGLALVLLVAAACVVRPARGDIPPPELLEELETRLAPPPACGDQCLQVARLALAVDSQLLELEVELHAAAPVAYELPGPAARWLPEQVTLDGRATSALTLAGSGHIAIRLTPGRHVVRARGPIFGVALELEPGSAPRSVVVEAPQWTVSGLSERGLVEGALTLTRRLPPPGVNAPDVTLERASLPTWATVTRRFALGVTWRIETEVARVGPSGAPVSLRLPLLAGERVTSPDVVVENGVALVRLGPDAGSTRLDSELLPRETLELAAAGGAGYNERWVLSCSPIYRCEPRGLAPIRHQSDGRWEPAFAPWPGETLAVAVTRPAAASGSTATLDSVRLELWPGSRLLRARLGLLARASAPAIYTLSLPAGSEVDVLEIDGSAQPIRQNGERIALSLEPGAHEVTLGWQEPTGLSVGYETPRVQLDGGPLANVELTVHLPEQRWLLWATGPRFGPAILFWSHLVLILLLAPVLARLPRSPLSVWQWALLGLGLTQVPTLAAGAIAGWFFIIAFQSRFRPERPFWFNARQVGLLLLTLAFLACLFAAVYDSLLNTPDMAVTGAGSSERLLHWYTDRADGELPRAWVLTVSLWVWRVAMLAWALWLASHLVGWLKWAWLEVAEGGIWKLRRKPAAR